MLLPRPVQPVCEAVWPRCCLACGGALNGSPTALCATCRDRVQHLQALPCCPRCGRSASPLATDRTGCPGCRRERFWNHRGLVRVGPYEPPLRDWLLAIKYGRDRRALEQVAQRLAQRLTAAPWFDEVDALIAVPRHWLRRLERRWDHASVLAGRVARIAGRPLWTGVLRRCRFTPSLVRAAQTRQQRFELVRDSFRCRRPGRIRDKTLCLIDNVVVTGATLCEAVRTLRRSGAARVHAAVVCRQSAPGDWTPDVEVLLRAESGTSAELIRHGLVPHQPG